MGENEQVAAQASTDREEIRQQIAERLTAAREKTGLGIEDVADRLKLPPAYLRAFESGDWRDMPEEVYTLGFLRQYAGFVGLDLSDDIHRLKSGDYHLTKPVTAPEPPTAPTRKWAIISAILFIVFFVLFNLMHNDSEKTSAPVIEQPAPAAPEPLAAEAPQTPEPQAAVLQAATEPAAEIRHVPDTPAVTMHRFTFLARDKAVWLQVFSPEHKLIREALLQANERLRIEVTFSELRLTCGNAAALQVSVDGNIVYPSGSLGVEGEVLRDFKLTVPAGP